MNDPRVFRSTLHRMTQTTPTVLWNDSCAIGELTTFGSMGRRESRANDFPFERGWISSTVEVDFLLRKRRFPSTWALQVPTLGWRETLYPVLGNAMTTPGWFPIP
jgi:hypothetical protein